jgi:DtxR family transcriptional regulator, manganese transport regulator
MIQAQHFIKTRLQHEGELAEDYTELIYDLIQERGNARVTELAKRLGVSHVTAIRTVRRLEKAGLVIAKKHSPIKLTKIGLSMAVKAKKKHQMLVEFLLALGVPLRVAESDSEGIEHHISAATLSAIKRWLTKNH